MQEVRHDGSLGDIKPFNEKEMKKSLDNPEVKEVRVFKLRRGMKVNINGSYFLVTYVDMHGGVTLHPIDKPKRPKHSVPAHVEESEEA